jgi:hypothetical protein
VTSHVFATTSNWSTRQRPTAAEERSLALGTTGLEEIAATLRGIITGELAALHTALAAAGAPYVPGGQIP